MILPGLRGSLVGLVLLTAAWSHEPAVSQHAEALYQRYCAGCHGIDGQGDGPAASALVLSNSLFPS
jgi:mono/diheme cytochrome c family protein